MKIPFSIKYRDKIESGEYKVETGDGRSVRIISWDKKVFGGRTEIVALVPTPEGNTETVQLYCPDGTLIASSWNEKFKLFIVTPEPEMSELELAIAKYRPPTDSKDTIQKIATELLDLAKSQLLQSGELLTQEHHEKLMETLNKAHEEELEKAYKNADEVQYRKGREDALKDLPMWRNVEADKRYVGCVTRYMDVNGDWNYCMSSGKLSDDCQYISIAALEKLPKQEDHE